MKTKFTKGKWSYQIENSDIITIRSIKYNNKQIAILNSRYFNVFTDIDELEANAKLIAKSPIMYDYILKKSKEGDKEAQQIIATIQ